MFMMSMSVSVITHAQITFGPKLGFQATSIKYGKLYDSEQLPGLPKLSLQVGGVYNYQVSQMLSFYAEFYYAQKGKNLRSTSVNSMIKRDQATYHFIDLPALLRFSFPVKQLHAHWYVNVGPHVAYWLGGTGNFRAIEAIGSPYTYDIAYKIRFQEHEPAPGFLYLPDADRLQFGLDFGAGFVVPVAGNGQQKMMFDFRYAMGSTSMGLNEWIPIGNSGLEENVSFVNHTLQASVAYLFSTDLQSFRKGKSSSKRRR